MGEQHYLRKLGLRVRALRERRGMTLEDLADAGVSIRALQNIEAGRSNPGVLTLRRIADALVVEVAELLPPRR